MRKVKLNLEKLEVDSFATSKREMERGTVIGHLSFRCDSAIVCPTDLIDCPVIDTGSCSGVLGTCVTCGGAGCGTGGGQTSRCV
jgi:predicted RNA methylase